MATATTMPVLRQGMNPTNAKPDQVVAIKRLQDFLGLKTTPSDYGYFGPKTTAAVKAFQKAQGLKDDGIVGALTWAKIPVQATPEAKAQATANAAVQAAEKLKQEKATAQQKQAAKAAAKAGVPAPTIVINNPPTTAPSAPSAVVQQAATTAKKAVTATATKAKDAVVATHVVIKKQPFALQVVAYTTAALGAIAGVHAIREAKRKAF